MKWTRSRPLARPSRAFASGKFLSPLPKRLKSCQPLRLCVFALKLPPPCKDSFLAKPKGVWRETGLCPCANPAGAAPAFMDCGDMSPLSKRRRVGALQRRTCCRQIASGGFQPLPGMRGNPRAACQNCIAFGGRCNSDGHDLLLHCSTNHWIYFSWIFWIFGHHPTVAYMPMVERCSERQTALEVRRRKRQNI